MASGDSDATSSDTPPPDAPLPTDNPVDTPKMSEDTIYDPPDLDVIVATADISIPETSDKLSATTAKLGRISRRLRRALAVAESAIDASSDAYASVVVLSDHAKAGPANADDRERRASNHTSALRGHAAAIVEAISATCDLDAGLARSLQERATGASNRSALDAAI